MFYKLHIGGISAPSCICILAPYTRAYIYIRNRTFRGTKLKSQLIKDSTYGRYMRSLTVFKIVLRQNRAACAGCNECAHTCMCVYVYVYLFKVEIYVCVCVCPDNIKRSRTIPNLYSNNVLYNNQDGVLCYLITNDKIYDEISFNMFAITRNII